MSVHAPAELAVASPWADEEEEPYERQPLEGVASFVRASLGLMRPHWPLAVGLVLAAVPTVGLLAVEALIYRAVIDEAIPSRDVGWLAALMALLATSIAVDVLTEIVREAVAARLGARAVGDLRERLFGHLHALSPTFFVRAPAGELMFRFNTDLTTIENTLAREYPAAITRGLTIVFCGGLLFWVDWRMAAATLGLSLLFSAIPRLLAGAAERANRRALEESGGLAAMAQEALAALTVVRFYGLGDLMRERFDRRARRLERSTVRAGLRSGLLAGTIELCASSLGVIALAAGAYLALTGRMTIGTMIAFMELMWSVVSAAEEATAIVRPLHQATGAYARVRALLGVAPATVDAAEAVDPPPFDQALRFEAVEFAYPDGGPSGCGKSTLLGLLLRLHDPTAGRVALDGRDLAGLRQAGLRAQFGVVPQDGFLFDTSVRENIRLGRPDASDAEVEAAARLAEIHDAVVGWPGGYDARVGPGGASLSGGERQRLGLARALLRDPAVLVLDEATSALDPETEMAINQTVGRLRVGRTAVTVTHRLSAIRGVDRIVVLADGRVVEQGSHEALIAQDGAYARLWRRQSGISVSPDGSSAAIEAARLGQVPLFADLDDADVRAVAELLRTQVVQPGAVICAEGEPGDAFYIVARGSLDVLIAGDGAEPRLIGALQDGDFFGEIALLRDVPRTATVRARARSTLLVLSQDQFERLLERAPGLRTTVEAAARARLDASAVAGERPGSPVGPFDIT